MIYVLVCTSIIPYTVYSMYYNVTTHVYIPAYLTTCLQGKGSGPSRMMAITIDPVTGKSRVLDTDLNTGNTL